MKHIPQGKPHRVFVTPKIAELWLDANRTNREFRPTNFAKIVADMRADAWTYCVAPICFYADGDLADGQHRLWAIIETGKSYWFDMVYDLSREDGLNIDTGLKRDLVDNARISGRDDELSKTIISTARAMEFGTCSHAALSNNTTLAIVNKHREAALFAASHVRRKSLLCGSVVLAAVGRAYEAGVDHDKLMRFCAVLGSGLYNNEGETAGIAIRNYLLTKGALASSSALWSDTFYKVQNAIAAFAAGHKRTTVRSVGEETYPLRKALKPMKKAA